MAEKLVKHELFIDGSVDPNSLSEEDKEKHIMVIGKVADMYGTALDKVKVAAAKSKIGGAETGNIKELAAPLVKAIPVLFSDIDEVLNYVAKQKYGLFNIYKDLEAYNKSIRSYYNNYLKDVLANKFPTPVEVLDEHNRIVVDLGRLFDDMMGSQIGRVIMKAA